LHRLLYARQAEWSRLSNPLERILEFAQGIRLDTAALKSCVNSGRMQQLIDADKDYGRSLQVHSTPTLFINEQRIVGVPSEADLVRTIQRELARVQRSSQ
jgi:protein-disulfide isomerase